MNVSPKIEALAKGIQRALNDLDKAVDKMAQRVGNLETKVSTLVKRTSNS